MASAPGDPTGPRLRMGIIGLGVAGSGMAACLGCDPRAQVVAAADPHRQLREAFEHDFDGRTYPTGQELCASSEVDAVFIATPHELHARFTIAAAKHGKHVICEKPMALRLEDCDAMIDAVDQAGVHFVIGPADAMHTPIRKTREIIQSGELGRLGMIHSFSYKSFFFGPMRADELDPVRGGGVTFNQGPHQIDQVRWIGGGRVRSVRAMVGIWDDARPVDGAYSAFLEFEDGAAATLVMNSYDHFDSDEFHFWVGQGGQTVPPNRHGERRKAVAGLSIEQEEALKVARGYGGQFRRRGAAPPDDPGGRFHPHYGVTIASCERGDLRPSPEGVLIYGDKGKREIRLPVPETRYEFDELYRALAERKPSPHNGAWGKATLEVCLAILQAGRNRSQILLSHQVATPD